MVGARRRRKKRSIVPEKGGGADGKVELDGNFKEPFRASRVFEIFPLKELQASIDSSAEPLGDNNDENDGDYELEERRSIF